VAARVGGVVALVTAYRRQRIGEFAERREGARLFNERFATAAGQLGDAAPRSGWPGCMRWPADLADDWPQQRQTCVDVLCAYLRVPYDPEPAGQSERHAFLAERQVRHTVIRVITAHLKLDTHRAATTEGVARSGPRLHRCRPGRRRRCRPSVQRRHGQLRRRQVHQRHDRRLRPRSVHRWPRWGPRHRGHRIGNLLMAQ
jgi:hypothetical protein